MPSLRQKKSQAHWPVFFIWQRVGDGFGASRLTLRAAAPSPRLRRRSNPLGLSSPMLSPE